MAEPITPDEEKFMDPDIEEQMGTASAVQIMADQDGEFDPNSLMDQVRKQLEETRVAELFLDLPGYNGLVVARYGLVDGKELNKRGRRVWNETKDETERILLASMDTILAACTGIFLRPDQGEHNKLWPLDPHKRGEPAVFDADLAEWLGLTIEGNRARDVLYATFAENESAIVVHCARINRWLNDPSKGVEQILGGE